MVVAGVSTADLENYKLRAVEKEKDKAGIDEFTAVSNRLAELTSGFAGGAEEVSSQGN